MGWLLHLPQLPVIATALRRLRLDHVGTNAETLRAICNLLPSLTQLKISASTYCGNAMQTISAPATGLRQASLPPLMTDSSKVSRHYVPFLHTACWDFTSYSDYLLRDTNSPEIEFCCRPRQEECNLVGRLICLQSKPKVLSQVFGGCCCAPNFHSACWRRSGILKVQAT